MIAVRFSDFGVFGFWGFGHDLYHQMGDTTRVDTRC